MENSVNPFKSLNDTMAFDSRDWSKDKNDAWIYGIIIGWAREDDDEANPEGIYEEFNRKFGWDREKWNKLQTLNKNYLKQKNINEI